MTEAFMGCAVAFACLFVCFFWIFFLGGGKFFVCLPFSSSLFKTDLKVK